MKKLIIVISLVVFSAYSLPAQTIDDIYNADKLTWYGIDFTDAYFLTPADFKGPSDLKSKFLSWNNLIIIEQDYYNLKRFFRKDVKMNIDMVNLRNAKIDLSDRIVIESSKFTHLTPEKVQKIVSSFDTEGDESGIGLVFICESLSKPNLLGAYWVTFFDIKSKKVLETKRYTGKPKGFGIRNYWAKSYYNVMKKAGKDFR